MSSSSSSSSTQIQKTMSTMDSSATSTTKGGSNLLELQSGSSVYYEHDRRKISSVVISEEIIGSRPDGGVKYVEVPIVEEVTKYVPVKEYVDVERIVPKYEYETRERIVEIPEIKYVDKYVEKSMVQEVVINKPVKVTRDVPVEVIKTVPKIEYRTVEQLVEVPSHVVEVPKPYPVENRVPVPRYHDRKTPVVVAQTVRPVITTDSSRVVDVDVYEYEPEIKTVDVFVAKPIASHLIPLGPIDETHNLVDVPAAQYNSTLRAMNSHLTAKNGALPYVKESGYIPFLDHEFISLVAPVSDKYANVQHGYEYMSNSNSTVDSRSRAESNHRYQSSLYNQNQTRDYALTTTAQYSDVAPQEYKLTVTPSISTVSVNKKNRLAIKPKRRPCFCCTGY